MKPEIAIKEIAYHRNGVGGNGFYVILFTSKEGCDSGNMMAIVFDEPGSVAVLNTDLLAKGDIAFMSNSWRGDWFEGALRDAIKDKQIEDERK